MKLYRPAPDGGLEPAPVQGRDYRGRLRSRRWDAAPLENPEVGAPSASITVALMVVLLGATFIVIVLGYASGFWG